MVNLHFEAAFLALILILTVVNLTRRLPAENAIAAVYIVVISFVVQIVEIKQVFLLDTYLFGKFRPSIIPRPWFVPLIWLTSILNSQALQTHPAPLAHDK